MSLRRLNTIVMSNIVPFNFGMDYDDCLAFYDKHHDGDLKALCPSDPRTWEQEVKDQVNQRAKEQTELVNRLMKMPDDEFYAEVERLRPKEDEENADRCNQTSEPA